MRGWMRAAGVPKVPNRASRGPMRLLLGEAPICGPTACVAEENDGCLAGRLAKGSLVQPTLALLTMLAARPHDVVGADGGEHGARAVTQRASVWVDATMLGDDVLTAGRRGNLHGALLARLLEEGYRLGRPPEAISLRLLSTGQGIRILVSTANGVETHGTTVRTLGDVLEREIIDRALEALAHVEAAHEPQHDVRPRVSLQVRGQSDRVSANELYLQLLPSVAAADLVVVTPDAPADWRICVSGTEFGDRVLRSRGDISCPEAWSDPVLHREGSLSTLLREVQQDWALPPRQRGTTRARPRPFPGADDALPPGLEDHPHQPGRTPLRLSWSSGFAAGVVARPSRLASPGVDGLLRADVIATVPRGFGVGAVVSVMPAVRNQYRFVDVILAMGPRYRKRWHAQSTVIETTFGVDLGVLAHGASAELTKGTRAAFSLEVPLMVSLVPWPRLAFDLLVLPGLAGPSIVDDPVWDRGVLRLGLALGIRGFWGVSSDG
jgi:hypothetical protein